MAPRDLTPADWPHVNALHRAVWWPERSMAGWAWLDRNPANRALSAPLGWVIPDAQDRPAAFIGNFVQRFWRGDRAEHGATGFSLVVPPSLAGQSRALVTRLMSQRDCRLFYTFNANPRAAPIYGRFGLRAWPTPGHDLKLSWIVDPWPCLASRAMRALVARRPGAARLLGERLAPAPPSRADVEAAEQRWPLGVTRLADLSDHSGYAAFWGRLRAESGFIADRAPDVLRWRLADPDQTRAPVVLAWRDDAGDVGGYALAWLAKGSPIEPAALEIIDLLALDRHAEAVPALVRALLGLAAPLGAAKVRLHVAHPWLVRALGPLAAKARREGGWGHCHLRSDLPETVLDQWRATPFDADYGFTLRPPPNRPVKSGAALIDKPSAQLSGA